MKQRMFAAARLLAAAALLWGASAAAAVAPGAAAAVAPGVGGVTPAQASTVRDLLSVGRYDAAESLATLVLGAAGTRTPPDSLAIAEALEDHVEAMIRNGRGMDPRAVEEARRALGIRERALGTDAPGLVPALSALGYVLADQDIDDSGLSVLQRALELSRRGASGDSAETLIRIGYGLLNTKNHARGLDYFRVALDARREQLGPEHPLTAIALGMLGLGYWIEGKPDSAFACYDPAIASLERAYGPDHPYIGRFLGWKANSLRFTQRADSAAVVYRRAVDVYEHTLRATHPRLIQMLRQSGANELSRVRPDDAKRFFERSFALLEREFPKGSADYSGGLTMWGEYYAYIGDVGASRRYLEEALEIQRKENNKIDAAISERLLGGVLTWYGWPEQGLAAFERSMEYFSRYEAPDNPNSLTGKLMIAQALRTNRQWDRCMKVIDEILPAYERLKGMEVKVAECLIERGLVAANRKEYDKGARDTERALALVDGKVRRSNRARVSAMHILAHFRLLEGRYDEARRCFGEAYSATLEGVGPENPLTLTYGAILTERYLADGMPDSSRSLGRRIADGWVRFLRHSYRQLPERKALEFSSNFRLARSSLIALASLPGSGAAERRDAFDVMIRSRALVQEESAARIRQVRRSSDPNVSALQQKLTDLSRRLANLEIRAASTGGVPAEIVSRTRAERDRIEQALAASSVEAAADARRRGVGWAEVRGAIPPRSALVAYALWMPFTPNGWASSVEPRYAAFVLTPGASSPQVIDLGTSREIERKIASWMARVCTPPSTGGSRAASATRAASASRAASARRATEASERACREAGARVRAAVWDPVRALLGDASEVMIVPDGAIDLVSFGALPSTDGRYLVERGPVLHRLTAERDLVVGDPDRAGGRPGGRGLLAVGGPDFDRAGDPAGSGASVASADSYRGPHSRCSDFRNARFLPLTQAGLETGDIAALWSSQRVAAAGGPGSEAQEVVRLDGRGATEGAFKRLAPGKRVLHLATHGFVLDEGCVDMDPGERGIGGGVPGTAPFKPPRKRPAPAVDDGVMTLAGLALAGANARDHVAADEDDGILTAEEIAALDLSSVEWAVLSSCDSGRGSLRAGEGVLCLARAFQIAGARTTIMSLWSAEDRATREWMKELYRARFAEGKSTAESVREAAVKVLAARRSQGKSTHPYFWGGFVAAGDWR